MKTKNAILAGAAAIGALAVPSTAMAQDVVPGSGFVGVSAGLHDLGLDGEIEDAFPGFEVEDSSPIIGVFAGYDVPVGTALFAGVEGNYSFGTNAIDGEYGISGRLGVNMPGGAKVYGRVGYQWIDLDLNKIVGDDDVDLSDFEDTVDDYMVGVGADIGFGGMLLRANVDTVSFDTLRATVGVGMRF